MFKKLMIAGAALASTATAVIPTAPATAQYYDGYERHDYAYRQAYRDGYNRGPAYYDRGYYDRNYYDRGYYDHRSYRRCNNGTTGAVVGAIAGGLLGNGIAGRGDRTAGTLLGAAGGALAGNAIARADRPGYCR